MGGRGTIMSSKWTYLSCQELRNRPPWKPLRKKVPPLSRFGPWRADFSSWSQILYDCDSQVWPSRRATWGASGYSQARPWALDWVVLGGPSKCIYLQPDSKHPGQESDHLLLKLYRLNISWDSGRLEAWGEGDGVVLTSPLCTESVGV